jgi:hypothetical protein
MSKSLLKIRCSRGSASSRNPFQVAEPVENQSADFCLCASSRARVVTVVVATLPSAMRRSLQPVARKDGGMEPALPPDLLTQPPTISMYRCNTGSHRYISRRAAS